VGEEEGGMKPIPIIGNGGPEKDVTAEEYLAVQKQKHEQRLQWGFLVILGLIALGVLTPFVLWLSRIALGN
jgi:hypothetical protein